MVFSQELNTHRIFKRLAKALARQWYRPHFSVFDVTSGPRWRPSRHQDGGPHFVRSKMAAPTTSDPRWRTPLRQIQDGGPHFVRSNMAAPTKSDTRWRPLWRVRLHLGGWVNALDHGKVASRPRARCRSSLYTRVRGLSCIERTRIWRSLYWGFFFYEVQKEIQSLMV